jgi:hypothetical protein
MSKASKAKVKVDLTPIKKGVVECDACIDFNSMDQPEAITIVVDGLDASQINHFCKPTLAVKDVLGNPAVTGVLETGDRFEGAIAFIKCVSFGRASVQLECYLGEVTRGGGPEVKGKGQWVFGLSNYRIHIGDQKTEIPVPTRVQVTPEMAAEFNDLKEKWHEAFPNSGIPKSPPVTPAEITLKPGWRNNRITFTFAGRIWTLDDDLLGRWPNEDHKISEPVRSGTLATAVQEGDTEDAVQQVADDISDLLSLALGRDIKWVQCGRRNDDGAIQSLQYRKPGLLAFNQHGTRLADNWEPLNIKQFLEAGETVLVADREWWSVTIGLLSQVGGTKQLVVKCSLLNTLLDRITSKVNADTGEPQIDPKLNDRLDRGWFRWLLHLLLRTLSSKWERHRTDSLCDNVIKGWNAEPSFPEKVIRSCESLGIKAPSRSKLGFRHKLIHAGEFDKKLKTIEKKAEYLFGTEAIVLMLLVRMLGFEGYIYIQSIPPQPDPKKVIEFLAETPEPNGGK